MGKKKEENNIVVLDKENLLYQPVTLTKLGMDMNIVQRRTVLSFVRKLQSSIKEVRQSVFNGGVQLSLFDTIEQRTGKLGEDAVELSVHPRDIGVSAKNYGVAFETILKMENIRINLPLGNGNFLRVPLFYFIVTPNIKVDQYGNPCGYIKDPTIHFAIKKNDLEQFFDMDSKAKIVDYLDYTASTISGSYTLAIYQWLSRYKYDEKPHRESIWEFRRIVGINDYIHDDNGKGRMREDIIYPTFGELKKRVLLPAQKELAQLCETGGADFTFEFDTEYLGSKRAKNPDYITFRIVLSTVGEDIRADKNRIRAEIAVERRISERLRGEFQQTQQQITRLIKTIPQNRVEDFVRDMDNLSRLLADGKITIKSDLRSYANKTFTETAKALKAEEERNAQRQAETEAKPERVGEGQPFAAPVASASVPDGTDTEAQAKWEAFKESIRSRVGEREDLSWLPALELKECKDGKVTVQIPTRTFYELTMQPFLSHINAAFAEFFGGWTLQYHIKK